MKKIFLFSALVLAALWACTPQEQPGKDNGKTTEDGITLVSESTVSVPVDGDIVTVKFKSTADWTAASDADWLTVSTASGKAGEDCSVKASATKNETYDNRSAKITITAGKAKAEVTVNQLQLNGLNIKTLEYEVSAEGGNVEVEVEANVEYEVTIPEAVDWVHNAATKGMTTSKVNLTVDASTDLEAREAVIKIAAGDLSSSIKITQAAFEAFFEFDEDHGAIQYGGRLSIPHEGGTFTIGVVTNLDWRVHYDEEWPPEDTSWLEFKQEESSIVITVKPNDAYIARDNWIYVNAAEDLYGDKFGGYFQVYQDGLEAPVTPQMEWAVAFPDAIEPTYNRLAFTNDGALLVSDMEKIHALNSETGAYLKEIAISGVKPTSICSDDAGNIIIAENVDAEMNWDTGELTSGGTLNVYCAKSENDTPKLIALPNGLYGTLGGFRARGDLATKGSITGVAAGAMYWFGYDIANYEAVANYYGTQNSGAASGDAMWVPEYGAAISYGDDLHDGILFRAYDGTEKVYYRKDAYTPKWAADMAGIEYEPWTEITNAGAGGNENQNNMDVLDYNGKKILAFTQGYHFTWAGFNADIYVLDITDIANPQVLATVKTADWITAEWPNGANSADILLREGEGVIEMYVVHSGLATIAKFIFNP